MSPASRPLIQTPLHNIPDHTVEILHSSCSNIPWYWPSTWSALLLYRVTSVDLLWLILPHEISIHSIFGLLRYRIGGIYLNYFQIVIDKLYTFIFSLAYSKCLRQMSHVNHFLYIHARETYQESFAHIVTDQEQGRILTRISITWCTFSPLVNHRTSQTIELIIRYINSA